MFNDDEQPIAPASNAGKKVFGFSDVGKASVKPYYPKEAPLAANTLRVLLDVNSTSSTAGRAPLDLVVVLDVSLSMRASGRLDEVKLAMRFIIKKLTPMDRLSIVTFNDEATRQCPLRAMSKDAVPVFTYIVKNLSATGGNNIVEGLKMGLQVLDGRRYTGARTAAVILVSDDKQHDKQHATKDLNPQNYPVYTVSFDAGADMNLLQKLASGGGTYNHVRSGGDESMVDVFSQLMAGLLTVVVRDLYLILSKPAAALSTHLEALDKIDKVDPGDFRVETDAQSGAVTVKFGDLFSGEVRKVVVDLSLNATDSSDYDAHILDVEVTYPNEQGGRKKLVGQALHVKRTSTASGGGTTPELEAELFRRRHAVSIRESRVGAAWDSLRNQELNDVLVENNPMVANVRKELRQLLGMTNWNVSKSKPYALAVELSHARQRFAAKGVDDEVRLFATPRMNVYLEQARKFADNPDDPLPTADEDDAKDADAHNMPPPPDADADNTPPQTTAAAGSLPALFRAPVGHLRQLRDPDALWEIIDTVREALMESEVAGGRLRAQLVFADSRVRVLEGELEVLRPAACAVADLVRARGGSLAERLQEVPARIHAVAERGVLRGASTGLAAMQLRSGYDLRGFIGFPEGQGSAQHGPLVDSFREAAEAIVADVSSTEIIEVSP